MEGKGKNQSPNGNRTSKVPPGVVSQKILEALINQRNVALLKRGPQKKSQPVFGPVSTIDTAPVSIGNTIRGSTPVVTATRDGERVRGRDFLLTVDTINNASGATWTLAGGAPITPSCMTTSVLKQLSNMYSEYQVHAVAFHYVTAAVTSTPGSVMMYVGKSRASPGVITNSPNLLPFVLSDECTVISPVWQNASSTFTPIPRWYTTALGNDEGLHEQACGEFFIFDKASSSTTPGYVIMDYDISFRGKQVNIKSSNFPIGRMKYTQMSLTINAAVVVNVTPVQYRVSGVLLDGATMSLPPLGAAAGDVYKIIVNATNSTGLVSNVWTTQLGDSIFQPLTPTDGFTCYGLMQNTTTIKLFPTYEGAFVNSNPFLFGVNGAQVHQVYCYISLVGSVGTTGIMQAAY